jgi:hypothetical protein
LASGGRNLLTPWCCAWRGQDSYARGVNYIVRTQ